MGDSLFISSFRSFRRIPAAALFAATLFALAETAAAVLWRPGVVGIGRYEAHSTSYDYGYAADVPRLFSVGPDWRYYPTEYVNIRPFSIRRSKGANEIRVFVLGGSVSRGSGVPDGADYASQLERALNTQLPMYEWKIINLSADGFGTTRMLSILIHMLPYKPDALIVHPHGTNEYEDERDARYRKALRAGINGALLHSRLVVLLKKAELAWLQVGDTLPTNAEDEEAASRHPENVLRWEAVYQQNIARIMCVSRELGIPAFFVGRAERDAPAFRNDRVDRLNAAIRSAPLYVDPAAALAKTAAESPGASLWYNNTHYSEAGHAVVAGELLMLFRSNRSLFDRLVLSPRAAAAPRLTEITARCSTPAPSGRVIAETEARP